MKRFRISKLILIFVIIATLVIGSSSISFAATSVKKVNYLGGGQVEISFASKTTYKSLKISITDNAGTSYKSKVSSKSSNKVSFKIYNYKTGKNYRVEISGLKNGNASASFQIISQKKAISIAKKKAKILGATKFNNVEAESTKYRGTAVWKVTFDSNGANYTYHIQQQTGKVLRGEKK